jgi:hypothetical protein
MPASKKCKDTTGFSRVVLQSLPKRELLRDAEIPPTLVAWNFSFCHFASVFG